MLVAAVVGSLGCVLEGWLSAL